jgi:hypothetical protein
MQQQLQIFLQTRSLKGIRKNIHYLFWDYHSYSDGSCCGYLISKNGCLTLFSTFPFMLRKSIGTPYSNAKDADWQLSSSETLDDVYNISIVVIR